MLLTKHLKLALGFLVCGLLMSAGPAEAGILITLGEGKWICIGSKDFCKEMKTEDQKEEASVAHFNSMFAGGGEILQGGTVRPFKGVLVQAQNAGRVAVSLAAPTSTAIHFRQAPELVDPVATVLRDAQTGETIRLSTLIELLRAVWGRGCEDGTWTAWLNRDRPGGAGDYETLQDFVKAGQACAAPLQIQCQTHDGRNWQQAGQVYTCDTKVGGVCRNDAQQRGQRCLDYRVRFLCP